MSPDRRKEVTLKIIGRQNGSERFKPGAEAPRWAPARGNLTCLSHVYNLYFVAQGGEVWVYEPSFPTQVIGHHITSIKPRPTGVNMTNYLPDGRPHDINHIMVDFLGDKEILLFCTDCGDVFFYYTSRIHHAVQQEINSRASLQAGPPLNTMGPTRLAADFAESVNISAWGLSVHRKARKIAVSSNTHQVTIFQFAVTDPDENCLDPSAFDSVLNHSSGLWYHPHVIDPINFLYSASPAEVRQRNWRFSLPETRSNLPYISFCNTSDDPNGDFLATGDIEGKTMLWKLRGLNLECWTAHFCNKKRWGQRCNCLQGSFNDAIWGLYWVDPKCFLKYGPIPKALGREEVWTSAQDALDITDQRYQVPNANSTFGVFPGAASGQENDADGSRSEQSDESLAYDSDQGWSEDGDDMDPVTVTLDRPEREPEWSFRWEYLLTNEFPATQVGYPRCPFLSISSKHLALHQPRDREKNMPGKAVAMRHPLKQIIDGSAENYFHASWWRGQIQRMSMHALILELGVLVAASPTGRCAVVSLLQADQDDGKPFYFYRLDWILPTQQQELRMERPGFVLMGLAVGPVQGYLGEPRPGVARKWRLMLQYSDFSILSYELSREDGELKVEI